MAQCMLSTTDNPYDYFEDFDAWYAYDVMLARQQNRPTCLSYLARMCLVANDTSDFEYETVMEDMIDEIVDLNLTGTYCKVTEGAQKGPKTA